MTDAASTAPTRGGSTAAGIEVAAPGAPDRLAGPGTGRAVSQPADARTAPVRSFEVFDFPVPTGREEEWRFTPLARLRGLHDGTAVPNGKVLADVDAPAAVRIETVERDDPRVGSALLPADRVAALALGAFTGGVAVTVPAEVVVEPATTVTLTGDAGTAFGHLLVDAGPHSRSTVVVDHRGSGTYAANAEYLVADGAELTVVSLQDWAADAVHVGHHVARLGRDARFRSVVITLGGDLVRLSPTVQFTAPGAEAELLGLYFADAGQHLEHRLLVDHAAPHCRSKVTYKGALQGAAAHGVWIGDVLIRAAAVGTDTYELNRNLLLTDGARADSVPNLEIQTGEVIQAGHASATGRLDDEQLFYLTSRGIPATEARRLVVRGFFADVIAQVRLPELQERLSTAIEDELARVLG